MFDIVRFASFRNVTRVVEQIPQPSVTSRTVATAGGWPSSLRAPKAFADGYSTALKADVTIGGTPSVSRSTGQRSGLPRQYNKGPHMKQRIHQALDGEIDRFALSRAELDEVRRIESEFDAVLNVVPVDPLPDLSSSVLVRIREQKLRVSQPASKSVARKNLARWLWKPRQISFGLRPVYALAATALIAVLVGQVLRPDAGAVPPMPQVFTRFVLRIPNAQSVSLAGDFTDWKPSFSMTRSGAELWTVVVPLEPGVHTYSFVIDGERWIADPLAPAVDDGFGGVNSRVAVLTPDARKS